MVFQRSEEQKKAFKQKLYTVTFFALLLGTVVYFGPGLHRLQVEPALRDRDADGLLFAAEILWWTGRREQARAVYEDVYLLFRGDELADDALYEMAASRYGEDSGWDRYVPQVWYSRYWDAENEAFLEPELQPVDPQGKPHPRLPEALLRLGQYWEDEKERIHYVHIYMVIDRCFPDADPELRERAKKGLLRAQTRSL